MRSLTASVGPALLLLAVGGLLFPAAGRDDAYLTYWSAETLAKFGALLNYNGQPLEQSSSLLHVLLLALVDRVMGVDAAAAGRWFSMAAGVATLPCVHVLARRIDASAPWRAVLLTATTAFFVYWSFGGLETTLAALVGLLLILSWGDFAQQEGRWLQHIWLPAAATASFAMVRPESPLILGGMLAAGMAFAWLHTRSHGATRANRRLMTRMATLAGLCIAFSAVLVACRLAYAGSPLPQPAMAKAGGISWQSLEWGLGYVRTQLLANGFLAVLVVLAVGAVADAFRRLVAAPQLDPFSLFSLLFIALNVAFVVTSGGDWMEGGRFFVPFVPELAICMASAATRLELARPRLRASHAMAALVALQLGSLVVFAREASMGIPLWAGGGELPPPYDSVRVSAFERQNRVHRRDIPMVLQLDAWVTRLARIQPAPVRVMSKQMGMVSFHVARRHFGRVEFLDLVGLADAAFTRCPVTAGLPRDRRGLGMTYELYFEKQAQLAQHCAIAPPDIIFDLTPRGAMPAEQHGYTTVYSQRGWVPARTGFWVGRRLLGDQFIAVRAALLREVGDFPLQHLKLETLDRDAAVSPHR